jgi:hypothetical protein
MALLFILPKKLRETLPGDLEEEFNVCIAKMGHRAATIWYWWQVIRSAAWLLPMGVIWGLFAWLMQKISR